MGHPQGRGSASPPTTTDATNCEVRPSTCTAAGTEERGVWGSQPEGSPGPLSTTSGLHCQHQGRPGCWCKRFRKKHRHPPGQGEETCLFPRTFSCSPFPTLPDAEPCPEAAFWSNWFRGASLTWQQLRRAFSSLWPTGGALETEV